jgi:hypothetical protein
VLIFDIQPLASERIEVRASLLALHDVARRMFSALLREIAAAWPEAAGEIGGARLGLLTDEERNALVDAVVAKAQASPEPAPAPAERGPRVPSRAADSGHYALPLAKRRELVTEFEAALANGEIENQEGWIRDKAHVTPKTFRQWRKEPKTIP